MARKHNPRGSVGRPLNRTFIVIGDGETEVAYFTQMKRSERLQINLQPELPSKKHSGWQYILASAENFAKDKAADGIYCLIDMDKVIEERAQHSYMQKKKKLTDKYKSVVVLENMPCIEVWFLRHFSNSTASLCTGDHAITALKKHLTDYGKSVAQLKGLYDKLKGKQADAILHAKQANRQRDDMNPCFPLCETHELIEVLLEN